MIKVAIVVGHNGVRQGAYGNFGQSEWQFNDELMKEMAQRDMLQSDDVEVYVLYRSSDMGYTDQMIDVHMRMETLGCKYGIELHFNSFHRPEANGNEVLYCSKAGKVIADIFDEEMDTFPNRDRGVKKVTKKDRGGGFCCRGRIPTIILEPFFGAYQTDFIYGGKNRMLLMTAISNGLKRLKDV